MDVIAVLTSGGDAPGMNSAVVTLAKLAAGRGVQMLGVEQGWEGLMEGRFRPLTHAGEGGLRPVPDSSRPTGSGARFSGLPARPASAAPRDGPRQPRSSGPPEPAGSSSSGVTAR